MEEKESLCEYQGNRFALEKQGGWYSRRISYVVKNITVMNTRLQLPDFCGEIPVESWHMHGGGTFPMVKELFIPSSVTDISIDNGFFPALEKVEVEAGHSQFSTDGKMLFSADGSFCTVLPQGIRRRRWCPEKCGRYCAMLSRVRYAARLYLKIRIFLRSGMLLRIRIG